MITRLVLDQILSNLPPSAVDDLRMHNRFLRDYIGSLRHTLPLHRKCLLGISDAESDGDVTIEHESAPFRRAENTVPVRDVMQYVSNCAPNVLYLKSKTVCKYLKPGWLKSVDYLELVLKMDKPEFRDFLQNLNCTYLELLDTPYELNADEILEKMPAVHKLKLGKVELSAKTIPTLEEKTQLGKGLYYLYLGSSAENPVDAGQLVHFMKNASFNHDPTIYPFSAGVQVNFVSGTKSEFDLELFKPGQDWSAREIVALDQNIYKCCRSNRPIRLEIEKFTL